MIVALIVVAAGLMGLRSFYGWSEFDLRMVPDFELYTAGGVGLYPSPLGRLAGSLGPDVFAGLSIGASVALVLVIGFAVRRRRGGLAAVAGLAALAVAPASLYFNYAGIDALALLPFALAAAGVLPIVFAVVAGLTHLSLAPYLVLLMPRPSQASWWSWFVLVPFGFIVAAALLMTPYAGILTQLVAVAFVSNFVLGLAAWAILSAPLFLFGRPSGRTWLAALIGAAECGAQNHLQARYLLPAVVLGFVDMKRPAFSGRAFSFPLRAFRSRNSVIEA